MASTDSAAAHPYQTLTPDLVMDALASVGVLADGRLTALGSYENRVYLAHLESPVQGHAAVVAKFYRPGRWRREQILEEHAFAAELMAAEVPAVGPLVLPGLAGADGSVDAGAGASGTGNADGGAGTTLHTVSRILSAWEEAGLVDPGRQKLLIKDPHRLLLIADGVEAGLLG